MAAEENDKDSSEDGESAREKQLETGRRQLQRGRLTRLTERLSGGPERPGEQKIGRSPVVLLLVGGTVGAAVLAAIFWIMIGSTKEERRLQEAMTALDQQKYLDAEELFLKFLRDYSRTSSSPVATIGLHRTRVEKNIITTTPDVVKGMEEFNTFVRVCNELPGFDQQKDNLKRYADRLTYAGARVAEISQEQKALDVSVEALQKLRTYSGEAGIPASRAQDLENRQRIAAASIAKKVDFLTTLDKVKSQLDAGDTIGAIQTRRDLLDKYPILEGDKDVLQILQDILNREKEFVVRTDLGRDAGTLDDRPPLPPSFSLALRTQATTDLSSQGRRVFAMGIDSCVALDADTGAPAWKRPVGLAAPFAPILVKSSDPPGVLVYSTLYEELQLLSQADGKLLWRQPTGSRPTGPPVLVADNFYVTTEAGELWQIAANTGRAAAKLKFSQKVIGPPAVSNVDPLTMVIPGDQTLIYTVSTNPFGASAVSFIPHRAGSITSPMIAAGRYFLMVDNATSNRARLQTLQLSDVGQLSVVAEDTVDGQVNDPCLLRGNELFVPSTPQRVTVFRVTDDAGEPPLARVGSNQLEEGLQTRMFLLAGPGGQVWLGGRDLRKFQTQTNAVKLDSGVTAEGIHVEPIQLADEAVFLTTRNPLSESVFFTRADPEQMRGIWRLVLGSRLVALGTAAGGESLLAVTDYGEAYRAPLADIQTGGFSLETVSRFRLPDKLTSSVQGLVMKDGRPVAWCGQPEPTMWTFTVTGQLERKWTLPDAPQIPPVALDAGVVFAMPSRLHLSGVAGGSPAEDYRSAQTQDQQQAWKSLTALSGVQVLAVTGDNQFVRVEYRDTPRAQLAEVSVAKLPQVIEVPPVAANGFLFLATTEGKLVMMQASNLEVLAEAELGGVASAAPKASGGFVFVEVANQEAKVFKIDSTLSQTGAIRLDGYSLAGPPLQLADGLLAARSDGLLIRIDSDGNVTDTTRPLGQFLQQGPLDANGRPVVVGADGSLYLVDPSLSW